MDLYTLGSPARSYVPFYPFFGGEGSPTKMDYRRKGTLLLTSHGGPITCSLSFPAPMTRCLPWFLNLADWAPEAIGAREARNPTGHGTTLRNAQVMARDGFFFGVQAYHSSWQRDSEVFSSHESFTNP